MKHCTSLFISMALLASAVCTQQVYANNPFAELLFISSQVSLTDAQGNVLAGNSPFSADHIDGALIQFVNAGADGCIDLVATDGTPDGDDTLLGSFAIGDGVPIDQGEKGLFYTSLSPANLPDSFYVRIFDSSTVEESQYYAVTAVLSLDSLPKSGSWHFFDVNKYGLIATTIPIGLLPQGTPPILSSNLLVDSALLFEGEQILLSAQGLASSSSTSLSYAWDLDGDGLFDDAYVVNPTVLFNDATAITIGVKITDENGLSSIAMQPIVVLNRNPVLSLIASQSVSRDELLTIPLNFIDAGLSDTHTCIINWGDGILEELNAYSGLNLLHSFAKSGEYTVVITIQDDDGGIDRIEVPITIIPLPLLVKAMLNQDGGVVLEWNAEPDSIYKISFADRLSATDWQLLDLVSGDNLIDSGDDDGYDNIPGTSDDRTAPENVTMRLYRIQMK